MFYLRSTLIVLFGTALVLQAGQQSRYRDNESVQVKPEGAFAEAWVDYVRTGKLEGETIMAILKNKNRNRAIRATIEITEQNGVERQKPSVKTVDVAAGGETYLGPHERSGRRETLTTYYSVKGAEYK